MMTFKKLETATREELADELAAACEPTEAWENECEAELRHQVHRLISTRTPMPSEAEEALLLDRLTRSHGDAQEIAARQKIYDAFSPMVHREAFRRTDDTAEIVALVKIGMREMGKCLRRFDRFSGKRFRIFAQRGMCMAMDRHMEQL